MEAMELPGCDLGGFVDRDTEFAARHGDGWRSTVRVEQRRSD